MPFHCALLLYAWFYPAMFNYAEFHLSEFGFTQFHCAVLPYAWFYHAVFRLSLIKLSFNEICFVVLSFLC
jgi:hypothetical protein